MPAPSPSPLHDILRYDDVAVKFLFEHYYVPLVIFAKNYLPDIENWQGCQCREYFSISLKTGRKLLP